jgi:hypothetical protein
MAKRRVATDKPLTGAVAVAYLQVVKIQEDGMDSERVARMARAANAGSRRALQGLRLEACLRRSRTAVVRYRPAAHAAFRRTQGSRATRRRRQARARSPGRRSSGTDDRPHEVDPPRWREAA